MFGISKRERAAFEAHIASQNEQIHWLRSCLPWVVPMGPTAPGSAPRTLGSEPAPVWPAETEGDLAVSPLYMSDEEEEVQSALERGDIDTEEAKAILKTLGLNPEIDFQ